jgi:phosphohistidine phosphatase SixA
MPKDNGPVRLVFKPTAGATPREVAAKWIANVLAHEEITTRFLIRHDPQVAALLAAIDEANVDYRSDLGLGKQTWERIVKLRNALR